MHEIIIEHTNQPESAHFLEAEIIEYRSQAEKTAEKHNWNAEDREYAEEKALEIIKRKLNTKYPDVKYSEQEITGKLKNKIAEVFG